MRTTTKKLLTVLALVVVAFWATPSKADLILNGSFEDGQANIGDFITVAIGGTQINNWSVTSGTVDYIGGYWTASDGSRSIDLSGNGAGTMAATAFNTIIDAWYKITFDMAGNPDSTTIYPQGIKTMKVAAANGSQLPYTSQQYTFDTTGKTKKGEPGMGWVPEIFTFKATGTSTTLSFTSLTNSGYGPALDNVKGSMIPIPGAMILLGAGLVRLVTYSRRKRTLA
jgi:choice-of-anchor C domain-containing protein